MAETKNEKGDKAEKGAKPGKGEKPAAKGGASRTRSPTPRSPRAKLAKRPAPRSPLPGR